MTIDKGLTFVRNNDNENQLIKQMDIPSEGILWPNVRLGTNWIKLSCGDETQTLTRDSLPHIS